VPHSLKLFGWCRDVAFDPLVSAAKGSHPRFYRSRSLSLLWLLGILSQRREQFAPFSFGFWEFTSLLLVYLNTLWMLCLYRRDTTFELCFVYFMYNEPKFSLVKSDMSCSTAIFYTQPWRFRSFQIRASLSSPCHYILRTYTTKNLKETCTLQGPIHRCQNVH